MTKIAEQQPEYSPEIERSMWDLLEELRKEWARLESTKMIDKFEWAIGYYDKA